MKHSISFSRLAVRMTAMFSGLCLIVVAGLAVFVRLGNERSIREEQRRQFNTIASESKNLFKSLRSKEIDVEQFGERLGGIGSLMGCRIFIYEIYPDKLDSLGQDSADAKLLDNGHLVRDLKNIVAGKTVNYETNWIGIDGKRNVVFYGQSLYEDPETGGMIVVLIYALPGTLQMLSDRTWTYVLYCSWIAAIFAAIIAYALSLRIARPLVEMSRAARVLSLGESALDIQVSGRDEVGQLADSFNRMQRKLADNERMRRNFLVNVSHDMRTPLTTMIGLIKGLRQGWVTEENAPQALEVIESESERLQQLTGDILDLARMQSGATSLNIGRFEVSEFLQEAARAQQPGDRSIEVWCETFEMVADRPKLMRVVYNLAQNAVKHGAGTITLIGKQTRNDVQIIVQDEGAGILPEKLEQLFDRFYRGDESRGSAGSGLGLNIAREIVRMHDGDISVESSEGCTQFILTIPRVHERRP